MQSIADIMPHAIRRGGLGRKIREQEGQDLLEEELDNVLPGDLRGLVQVVAVEGSVATLASLSGIATREIKRQEGYIFANINKKITGKKISRIRYLT